MYVDEFGFFSQFFMSLKHYLQYIIQTSHVVCNACCPTPSKQAYDLVMKLIPNTFLAGLLSIYEANI